MGRVTIAVRLKPEANRDGEHVVRIRITKDRLVANWALSMSVPEKHFNEAGNKQLKNWIRKANASYLDYNKRLLAAYVKAEEAITFFESRDKPFTSVDLRSYLEKGGLPETLLTYFAAHIRSRIDAAGNDLGKIQTAEGYKDTLKVLRWALRELNHLPDTVTDEMLDTKYWMLGKFAKKDVLDLKDWLGANYGVNTVSTHMTKLRHVLYLAADQGLVSYEKFPMRGVSISFKRKKVQRLREDDIDQLMTVPATKKRRGGGYTTKPTNAQPLAMAMYFAHGARLGDAVCWRMHNYVVEGDEHRLRYETGKNKKTMSVLLPPEAIELLAPYRLKANGEPKGPNEFLFPYLPTNFDTLPPVDKHVALRKSKGRARWQIVTHGKRIGLDKHLTPHVMRHSFADMMRRAGVALETRQEALGHSDIKTTRNYEEQFDQQAVDDLKLLYQKRSKPEEENNG